MLLLKQLKEFEFVLVFEVRKENNNEKKQEHGQVNQQIVVLTYNRKGKGKDYWGNDLRKRERHDIYPLQQK